MLPKQNRPNPGIRYFFRSRQLSYIRVTLFLLYNLLLLPGYSTRFCYILFNFSMKSGIRNLSSYLGLTIRGWLQRKIIWHTKQVFSFLSSLLLFSVCSFLSLQFFNCFLSICLFSSTCLHTSIFSCSSTFQHFLCSCLLPPYLAAKCLPFRRWHWLQSNAANHFLLFSSPTTKTKKKKKKRRKLPKQIFFPHNPCFIFLFCFIQNFLSGGLDARICLKVSSRCKQGFLFLPGIA